MSNTYLSKIDISNFRSFGPNFSWEIPPSPSLVIIYGMNGLGKTSFFEALEWLFTGDVRRISSALSKESIDQYLTRRGANELSHFVSATFGPKEDRILRSATKVPSREDVLEALAHPDWEEKPDDITPYLRLTKFLPQSKRYRFEEENPADQWKLLRGPAGVDRLEEIRQALGSTKTTNAFNREITRLKQELEIESNRYRDWSELIVTRDNLTLYSSETDYIDLDRVRRDLDDLEKLLLSKYDVSSLGDAEDLSPKEMSDRFHNRIVDVQSLLRNEESKLESFSNLHSLIMDWSENSSKTQLFSNEIDSKQERLETIGLEIKNLSDGRIAVSENYNNAVEKEKSKDQEISNILNIKSSFNQQTEKITEISNIQKELVQENKELERIRERLKQFEAAKIKRTEIVEMIGTLKKRQNELITFQANVDEFFRRKEESDRREGSIHSLKKELEKARAEKAQNRLRVSELERDRNALIAKRTDILSQVEVMAEALATLCRHIDEDSLECPLCTAKYETGKLQSLARKALEDSGIDTIEIDQGLVQVKDEIEQIKEVEISIDNQIASIPIQIDELERLRTAAGEEWDRIESTRVLIGGISSSNLVQDASSRKGEVEAQIESLENDLSTHEAGEQIDLEITNLTAQKSDYEISIEEKEGRLNEINSEIEHAQAAIVHYRDSNDISEINLELLETMLVNREEEKQIAHDHVNDWRTRVEELNRELQRAEEKQNSLKLELQTLHTKRQSVDERLKVLKQRWEVFFPDVSPTPEPLQRSIALSEETVAELVGIENKCKQALEKLTIFESLSRVTEIEDKIMAERNSCGDCTEEEVSENFAGKIQRLEEQITHANDVKKRAQQIAEHLKSEAEHFNESTLKPLSSRIQKFHDVLSSFRYEISLETKTAKGGTKLNQRVNRKGNSTDWVHPLAELSDGQISVQGLATLFAASTEYRWSRWPSVLLDDPLQSSDLLHASAFIDILRGLIKDLKYQVFLSSHDLEEARYIIRKCERSGIDVSQCHLLGPGVNGVRAVFS